MNTYIVKYRYNRPGSLSGTIATFTVRADSDGVAFSLGKDQVRNKHPGYEITMIEIRKR